MPPRSTPAFCRLCAGLLAALLALVPVSAQTTASQASDAARRAADRVRSLRAEADALLRQEQSVLGRLRRLEAERAARVEQVRAVESEAAAVTRDLHGTEAHLASLEKSRAEQGPILRQRLVELYKLGAPGYARLLAGVDDLRDVGRAYRAVTALAAIDRERARAHASTLASLRRARDELAAREGDLARLRRDELRARADAEAAVKAHAALVDSIDAQRDLNARLTSELVAAQQKLEQQLTSGGATDVTLPIAPFKGLLDWPAAGHVARRFGAAAGGPGGVARPGIDLATAPGAIVNAVHEGQVAYAAPFSGFGNLVIVDHGARTFSVYGYLGRIDVTKGAHITRGEPLGTAGTTPSGADAVSFEMRIDGRAVDPLQWLKGRP
jgi:septal ring factor EnvC (AmiA/AmiB activator)